MAMAGSIAVPFHMTMSSKDRVVSPAKNREFFERIKESVENVKYEYEVGHEILANEEINTKVITDQIEWLESLDVK